MDKFTLIQGENPEALKQLTDNSVDSIVTDPPYELGFMGKKWDGTGIAYNVEMWAECLRVLKPGGYLLSFGGSRTYHRMACAIEDAGFEIRDMIEWVYGSGFPKSHNILSTIKKELKCKAEKLSANIAEIISNQLSEMSETDSQNIAQEIALVKVKEGERLEVVKTVEKSFTLLGLTPEEKTEESKEHSALMYVSLNGKEKTLSAKITLIGRGEGSSEVTDTLQLRWDKENIDSNTQLSLKKTLADKSNKTRMSTILTEIDKTIELKICDYLQNQNMQSYITNNHTALKPAHEPICVARKPLAESTIAGNVLEWGTGAINIDGCRVETTDCYSYPNGPGGCKAGDFHYQGRAITPAQSHTQGRWPANFIHSGEDEVVGLFPESSTTGNRKNKKRTQQEKQSTPFTRGKDAPEYTDSGSAARFFASFPLDEACTLCYNTYTNTYNKEDKEWKNILARNAEKNGWTSHQTKEFIARVNVIGNQNENLAQNVKSAGNLCDACAILIAVALVGIKTSDFKKEELQVILDYIGSYKKCILIQNLVSFAELWESIDIIPTTRSLMILFGSVQHAIENYTNSDKQEAEGEDNVLARETSSIKYCAKASKRDRDEGLDGMEERKVSTMNEYVSPSEGRTADKNGGTKRNYHPTVKPTDLMRYLCRLVTPPDGVILDPFMGSGSTGKAAVLEGFNFTGIDTTAEYIPIAKARIEWAQEQADKEL